MCQPRVQTELLLPHMDRGEGSQRTDPSPARKRAKKSSTKTRKRRVHAEVQKAFERYLFKGGDLKFDDWKAWMEYNGWDYQSHCTDLYGGARAV